MENNKIIEKKILGKINKIQWTRWNNKKYNVIWGSTPGCTRCRTQRVGQSRTALLCQGDSTCPDVGPPPLRPFSSPLPPLPPTSSSASLPPSPAIYSPTISMKIIFKHVNDKVFNSYKRQIQINFNWEISFIFFLLIHGNKKSILFNIFFGNWVVWGGGICLKYSLIFAINRISNMVVKNQYNFFSILFLFFWYSNF